jgi:hypothetical protein
MITKKKFTMPQLIEYGTLAQLTQTHMPNHNSNPPAYGAQECQEAGTCKQGDGNDWGLPGGS